MFEGPAWLVSQFYSLTHNYAAAIGLVALTVMILVTPLTLKSTKGMLEMQRLQPEMKRLQAQYRGDRQKLNEEMMKLYQEHKVNPLASCLPLLLQMPVFIIMYRVLRGLSKIKTCTDALLLNPGSTCSTLGLKKGTDYFDPGYISHSSDLYKSLLGKHEMLSLGLDLSKSPAHFISEGLGKGLIYAALVVVLGLLYFAQQRMVASRAAMSPTMSASQAKLMQYLPVVFAIFQIFFLTGLVIYYITQAVFRIGQNYYITRRFYHGEDSLGRQAQAAGVRAREEAKANGDDKQPGGMFAQAKRDAQARREAAESKGKELPASRSGGTSRPGGSRPGGNSGRTTSRPDARSATNGKSNGARPATGNGKSAGNGKPNVANNKASNDRPSNDRASDKSNEKASKNAPPAEVKPEPIVSKRVTPPKNRPTPSGRPQRPTPSGRAPKPPKQ